MCLFCSYWKQVSRLVPMFCVSFLITIFFNISPVFFTNRRFKPNTLYTEYVIFPFTILIEYYCGNIIANLNKDLVNSFRFSLNKAGLTGKYSIQIKWLMIDCNENDFKVKINLDLSYPLCLQCNFL